MEQNKKFIYCLDERLANTLKDYYQLISVVSQGDKEIYIFENIPLKTVFNFSTIDKTKFLFSNKLTF